MIPFGRDRFERAARERGADVVMATSRHNVAYLTGGYYNEFFARDQRFGAGQYLSAVTVPVAAIESAWYIGRESERDFLDAFGPLWIADVQSAPRRPNMTVEVAAKAAALLRTRDLAAGTIAVELPFLPADAFTVLRRELPAATFIDATPILAEVRAVKRPDELERLAAAHRGVAEAIRATFAAARADDTMRAVAETMERNIEARGATYLYALTNVGPGLTRAGTSERWGLGRPLHIDAGAEVDGYRADVARMGSIGEPPARALEMFQACVAAQGHIRGRLGPGVACGDLWRIGTDALAAGPLGAFGKFQAHGIGLVSHEPPEVTQESTCVLEPGMAVSVETDYLDPDIGHIKLEDSVVVTSMGCEGLGDAHREWFTVGGA